jgi:hypothetical protein
MAHVKKTQLKETKKKEEKDKEKDEADEDEATLRQQITPRALDTCTRNTADTR